MHNSCLNNLCRICSDRAQTFFQIRKKETARYCKNSKDGINAFYGIDVTEDNDNHPVKICNKCYLLCTEPKIDKAKHNGVKEKAQSISQIWQSHEIIDCKVCTLYNDQKVKGSKDLVKSNL